MAKKTKIILDTNIYFSALIYKHFSVSKFVRGLKSNKQIEIYYTSQIKQELEANLIGKYQVSQRKIDAMFKQCILQTQALNINRKPDALRDDFDWHLFALAFQIEADFLITGDKDILAFQPQWQKTRIVKLSEFVKELEISGS
jgi:putative PIN family toxin of toxin-antitoxin system